MLVNKSLIYLRKKIYKIYAHTFKRIFLTNESIMVTNGLQEGLFGNFIWFFNFGHLFLSIFENQIYFLEKMKNPIYIIFKPT
jgi:hypothetical protein